MQRLDEARATLARLAEAGIDLAVVTQQLQVEGVAAFVESFDTLLANLEDKRARLLSNSHTHAAVLGAAHAEVDATLADLQRRNASGASGLRTTPSGGRIRARSLIGWAGSRWRARCMSTSTRLWPSPKKSKRRVSRCRVVGHGRQQSCAGSLACRLWAAGRLSAPARTGFNGPGLGAARDGGDRSWRGRCSSCPANPAAHSK